MATKQDAKKSKDWEIKSIIVTVICTLVGFVAGTIVTIEVTDTYEQNYFNQIVNNGIDELDYNINNPWYNSESYIEKSHYYSSLRTDALWEIYYNRERIFKKNQPLFDNLVQCLDEIDWINRYVQAQYTHSLAAITVSSSNITPSDDDISKAISKLDEPPIYALHRDMHTRYNSKTKGAMEQLKKYLLDYKRN